jgi:hypothetical protein
MRRLKIGHGQQHFNLFAIGAQQLHIAIRAGYPDGHDAQLVATGHRRDKGLAPLG